MKQNYLYKGIIIIISSVLVGVSVGVGALLGIVADGQSKNTPPQKKNLILKKENLNIFLSLEQVKARMLLLKQCMISVIKNTKVRKK